MKPRPKGFLNPDNLDPEVFDYVCELHDYLWKVVSVTSPGASGRLSDHLDDALVKLLPIKEFVSSLPSTHQPGEA